MVHGINGTTRSLLPCSTCQWRQAKTRRHPRSTAGPACLSHLVWFGVLPLLPIYRFRRHWPRSPRARALPGGTGKICRWLCQLLVWVGYSRCSRLWPDRAQFHLQLVGQTHRCAPRCRDTRRAAAHDFAYRVLLVGYRCSLARSDTTRCRCAAQRRHPFPRGGRNQHKPETNVENRRAYLPTRLSSMLPSERNNRFRSQRSWGR